MSAQTVARLTSQADGCGVSSAKESDGHMPFHKVVQLSLASAAMVIPESMVQFTHRTCQAVDCGFSSSDSNGGCLDSNNERR